MCNTTMLQTSKVAKSSLSLGRKRARDARTTAPETSRPSKRVSFCNRDLVLGTAQVYDRTSSPDPAPPTVIPCSPPSNSRVPTRVNAGVSHNSNFCGIWRRSHGFNWAALLELSGLDKAAIPEQVRPISSRSRFGVFPKPSRSFAECMLERVTDRQEYTREYDCCL